MIFRRHPLLVSYTACLAKRVHDHAVTTNAGRRHLFRHYISTLVSFRAKLCRQLREEPKLREMGRIPEESHHG